jgi:hypothetical protein
MCCCRATSAELQLPLRTKSQPRRHPCLSHNTLLLLPWLSSPGLQMYTVCLSRRFSSYLVILLSIADSYASWPLLKFSSVRMYVNITLPRALLRSSDVLSGLKAPGL